ncbi:MAG: PH domain-containing protein [Hyphomonadaceae bacterium]
MSYIDKSLAPGEEIYIRGKWPAIYWFGAWAALIVLGVIVVGLFIFLRAAIHMSTTQFAVTNKRVVLKRGWLNVRTEELATEGIEGVQLVQSIWGKLFGYGRVMVTGTGEAQIVFPPMAHPIAFRRAIEASRGNGAEIHIAAEDRAEIAEAAAAVRDAAHEEAAAHEPAPRRKRRSFVGLLSD